MNVRHAAGDARPVSTTMGAMGEDAERRRRRRHRQLQRQLGQRTHWTLYLGVAMLALGVLALVTAALLTR